MDLIKIDTKNPNEIIELIVVDKVLEMSSSHISWREKLRQWKN